MSACPYCEDMAYCLCDDCEGKITKSYQEKFVTLEAKLAEAQRQEAASFQALCAAQVQINALKATLAKLAGELVAGAHTLYREKAILSCDRDWLLGKAQKASRAIAALDAGSPQPPFPLALAREWAAAYAALSSGRDAAESNRLELAFNAACERLYESLDAGKEAGG